MVEQSIRNEDSQVLIGELESVVGVITDAIGSFPAPLREQKLFGEFTLKDILGHFSAWNWLTAINLMELKLGWHEYKWVGDDELDEFNAVQVRRREDKPWKEVSQEFVQSTEDVVDVYKRLTPEQYTGSYWPEPGYTVLHAIQADRDHFVEHLSDILKITSETASTANPGMNRS